MSNDKGEAWLILNAEDEVAKKVRDVIGHLFNKDQNSRENCIWLIERLVKADMESNGAFTLSNYIETIVRDEVRTVIKQYMVGGR